MASQTRTLGDHVKTFRTALVAVLTTFLIGSTAPVADARATSTTAARASNCKTYPSVTVCVKVLERLSRDFKIGYRDSIVNSKDRPVEGHCYANTQTTSRYGMNVSISAEGKAFVFAKVSAQVSVDISKEMSSGINVGTDFTVPAHHTTYCDRGIMVENFRVRRCVGNASKVECKTFNFRAPSRNVWHLYDKHN